MYQEREKKKKASEGREILWEAEQLMACEMKIQKQIKSQGCVQAYV